MAAEEHGPRRIDVSEPLLVGADKEAAYRDARVALTALLSGVTDPVAKMSTLTSVLTEYFPRSQHFWTGFYRSDRRENGDQFLIVGPFQGTVGCMEIDYGRGVCGAVARYEHTIIVPDTAHINPNDPELKDVIECDSDAKSEIVVPIFGAGHKLIGVYDVDSAQLDAFDEIDQRNLEAIMAEHFAEYTTLVPKNP